MRKRIGLTGAIASGKSTVAKMLEQHGMWIIDADELARAAVAPASVGYLKVIAAFGEDIVGADGQIDRTRLGQLVFADSAARAHLEEIIHPEVFRLADLQESQAPADATVVHVIPLLVEADDPSRFDEIIVVDISDERQIERLLARSNISQTAAQARINAQAAREQRLAIATQIINNDGTLAELSQQVDLLYARLTHA